MSYERCGDGVGVYQWLGCITVSVVLSFDYWRPPLYKEKLGAVILKEGVWRGYIDRKVLKRTWYLLGVCPSLVGVNRVNFRYRYMMIELLSDYNVKPHSFWPSKDVYPNEGPDTCTSGSPRISISSHHYLSPVASRRTKSTTVQTRWLNEQYSLRSGVTHV